MQKKGLINFTILSLLVLPLISAYGGYSIGDQFMLFLEGNIEMIIYATIFLGILLLVKTSLSKIFKGTTGGILAALVSILATYGIYTRNFDIQSFFYDLGIGNDVLPLIIVLVTLLLIGVVKSKLKIKIPDWLKSFKVILFWGGAILIAISRLLEYDAGEPFFEMGVVAVALSILLWLLSLGKKGSAKAIKKIQERIQKKEAAAQAGDPKAQKEVEKLKKELEKKQKNFEESERKRISEEEKRKTKETELETQKQRQGESFDRARKIGIQNLIKEREKEYNKLQNEIIPKIKNLSSKMGGGAFVKKRKDESDADYKERYKKARENHKHLSQAHQIAKDLRKKIEDIDKRIVHLQTQLKR
ncbi:hypothetical protein HOD88_00350 [archaeon]|jgi:hypothetical protein|nr:hypothetical protein [archaeon]